MDFEPSDDQRAIGEAVAALLARHAGAARAAALMAEGAYDYELERALDAAGFLDVALAPGAGALEAALVAEAAARAAGTAAVGAAALVVPLALGRRVPGPIALADAAQPGPVRFAADARSLVFLDGEAARLVPVALGDVAPVASPFGYPMGRVDARLAEKGERLAPGSGARLRDAWRVALAVEIAGTLQGALRTTVDYLKQRRQFGRAIASFQAVQHRLAACAVQAEGVRWLALEAAAHGAPAEAAAVAACSAALAAKRVFAETHQLSGAIGYTREHALHVFTMRLQALRLELGGAAAHARAAAAVRWDGAR